MINTAADRIDDEYVLVLRYQDLYRDLAALTDSPLVRKNFRLYKHTTSAADDLMAAICLMIDEETP